MSTTVTFGNVIYTLTTSTSGSYTASVTGNTLEELTNVTIPSSITDGTETYTVTSIGNQAFSNSSYLASIVIPETVTSIANGSLFYGAFFQCSKLTAVTIGANVTTIGESAFFNCSELTAVIIPDAVTSIGKNAFLQCFALTAVTIGASVTTIGNNAFAQCIALTAVTIPNAVTTIGISAFTRCYNVSTVTIGANVTTIGDYAFDSCIALTAVTISSENTTFFNGSNGEVYQISGSTVALFFCPRNITSYAIPDSVTDNGSILYTVTSIGDYAFQGCSALTAVTIGANVTTIGDYAFQNCSALTGVTIPDAVTSIGGVAFYECFALTAVTIGSGLTTMGNLAFATSTNLTSMYFLGDYPSGIDGDLFLGDNSLTLYYLDGATGWSTPVGNRPAHIMTAGITGVASITAFSNSNKTATFSIANTSYTNVELVVLNGFSGVTSGKAFAKSVDGTNWTVTSPALVDGDVVKVFLQTSSGATVTQLLSYNSTSTYYSVDLGVGIVSIGQSAFAQCIALTAVTIPDAVTSIGGNAFRECSALTAVIIGASVTTIGIGVFDSCIALTDVTISSENTTFFNGSNGAVYQISDSTTVSLFFCPRDKTTFTIPDSVTDTSSSSSSSYAVTSIGVGAFRESSALTAITIPDAVTSIGGFAFYGCSALTAVMIGENVTSIGEYAFQGCSALTAVTISSGNTTFFNGSNGEVYQISDSTVSLFFCPRDKTTFTIPDSVTQNETYTVTSIASLAFFQCSALTAVTIGANVTSIGDGAFTGCIALTAVTIPNAVTSICQSAFELCSALTAVTIGANVTTIGDYAFYDCYALTAVIIPDAVTSIGQDAFYLCSALTAVTIGSGLTTMGSGAFQYCGNTLTSMYFLGDLPSSLGSDLFLGDDSLTLYYLDGATGWPSIVGGRPAYPIPTITSATTPNVSISADSDLSTVYVYTSTNSGFTWTTNSVTMSSGYGTLSNLSSGTLVSTIANIYDATYADYCKTVTTSTPTPSSNVCFPAKTPIMTNQGPINIEDIDPAVHTIRNKKIVAITKTVAHDKNLVRIAKHALGHLYPEKTTLISQNHKVFFQGQMVQAKHLVDQARNVTLVPYNGEILYNVLLEQYEKMQVNNLIVETLHPEHKVAKLYRFLQNVDAAHHGKLIALFNKKDKEPRIHF